MDKKGDVSIVVLIVVVILAILVVTLFLGSNPSGAVAVTRSGFVSSASSDPVVQHGSILASQSVVLASSDVPVFVVLKDPEISSSSIISSQNQVVSSLDSDFTVSRVYSNFPALAGILSPSGLDRLMNNPLVEAVYFDAPVQAFLNDSLPLIRAPVVHSSSVSGVSIKGAGQSVCVLDTGVSSEFVPVIAQTDIVNNDSDASDDNGHGTHVAGIVASRNSTFLGVAPEANIVAVKVLNSTGGGLLSSLASGIDWCVSNADVYNISVAVMSLGLSGVFYNSSTCPMSIDTSINAAYASGLLLVAASGNDGFVVGISYPACAPNVTSVGSVNDAGDFVDQVSSFSNAGGLLDLLAPGSLITSTVPVSGCSLCSSSGFKTLQGTSQAAPHVAGLALLINQERLLRGLPSLSQKDLVLRLKLTGKTIFDTFAGLNFSRIDVESAVNNYFGNASLINSNLSSLNFNVSVGNFTVFNGSSKIVQFVWTDSVPLNFSQVIIRVQNGTDVLGGTLVAGLNLTKTVYVSKLNVSSNAVCIKDSDVSFLSEVSAGCVSPDEVFLECPGSSGEFSCSVEGSKFKVSGLHGSAVKESSTTVLACGDSIVESVLLDDNVTGCNETAITVSAANVVFDCQGRIIQGVGSSVIKVNAVNNVTIRNCVINNTNTGFSFNSLGFGIDLNVSNNSKIINNSVVSSGEFILQIGVSASNNVTVTKNTLSGSENVLVGVGFLSSGSGNLVSLNNISFTGGDSRGVFLSGPNGLVFNNSVSANTGIWLQDGSVVNSTFNTVVGFSKGIFYNQTSSGRSVGNFISGLTGFSLKNATNVVIVNNSVTSNISSFLVGSSNNTFSSNFFTASTLVINLSSGLGNLFYNNLFNKTGSGVVVSAISGNFWNTTYSCVNTNILGGNCSGGNFWSDYVGLDLDGDGVGDQQVPYNSSIFGLADFLPLTNVLFINVSVEGNVSNSTNTGNISSNVTEIGLFTVFDDSDIVLTIDFDSDSSVNLSQVSITKQASGASTGSLVVSGFNLSGVNETKALYLDRLSGSNQVCLKDAAISSISEISSACNGVSEVLLVCPGSSGNYSCSVSGNKYLIMGLSFSGVREETVTVTSSGGGGGGGSGGGGTSFTCTRDWQCGDWSTCSNDTKTRVCVDINNCTSSKTFGTRTYPVRLYGSERPSESQICEVVIEPSCFDGIRNQREVDVDCGGPCDSCPEVTPLVVEQVLPVSVRGVIGSLGILFSLFSVVLLVIAGILFIRKNG